MQTLKNAHTHTSTQRQTATFKNSHQQRRQQKIIINLFFAKRAAKKCREKKSTHYTYDRVNDVNQQKLFYFKNICVKYKISTINTTNIRAVIRTYAYTRTTKSLFGLFWCECVQLQRRMKMCVRMLCRQADTTFSPPLPNRQVHYHFCQTVNLMLFIRIKTSQIDCNKLTIECK